MTTTILRLITTGLFISSLAIATTACGDEEDPVVEVCQRLDSCDILATGMDANTCVDYVNEQLADFTADELTEAYALYDDCLSFQSCTLFRWCMYPE